MLTPFQVATSSRTRVVESRDLGDLAAHDPGDPGGPVAVADQDRLGVEGALDAVEGGHPLAVARRADDQLAAGHLVEVEGVQRLAGQQHHVVGDVDDVVDRPHGRRAIRRAFSHSGDGPIVTSVNTRAREPRAELRDLDGDRGVVGRPRPRPSPRRRRSHGGRRQRARR